MKTKSLPYYLLSLPLFALLISCGLKEEDIKTLQSSVQAVATLLEQADATVEVDLALISTAESAHKFITDAEEVFVRVPGAAKIDLTQTADGHYTATSKDNSDLEYKDGGTYQFSFKLPSEGEEGEEEKNYAAVTIAPAAEVSFEWTKTPAFAGDTGGLSWTPKTHNAIVTVYGPDGEITYSTFDFSEPQFEGDKWARLGANGSLTLSVDVFKKAGKYKVIMCAVTKNAGFDEELSADLGALSGFLAGKCVEPTEFDLSE
ncbi:MAG: hypothetical protein Kow0090_00730 [Myxococcota bacterium]